MSTSAVVITTTSRFRRARSWSFCSHHGEVSFATAVRLMVVKHRATRPGHHSIGEFYVRHGRSPTHIWPAVDGPANDPAPRTGLCCSALSGAVAGDARGAGVVSARAPVAFRARLDRRSSEPLGKISGSVARRDAAGPMRLCRRAESCCCATPDPPPHASACRSAGIDG